MGLIPIFLFLHCFCMSVKILTDLPFQRFLEPPLNDTTDSQAAMIKSKVGGGGGEDYIIVLYAVTDFKSIFQFRFYSSNASND